MAVALEDLGFEGIGEMGNAGNLRTFRFRVQAVMELNVRWLIASATSVSTVLC